MNALLARFRVIQALTQSFARSEHWWMLPMVFILVLLGLVLAGLQTLHYVAPFIYAVL
jgi:hypothetical protein